MMVMMVEKNEGGGDCVCAFLLRSATQPPPLKRMLDAIFVYSCSMGVVLD